MCQIECQNRCYIGMWPSRMVYKIRLSQQKWWFTPHWWRYISMGKIMKNHWMEWDILLPHKPKREQALWALHLILQGAPQLCMYIYIYIKKNIHILLGRLGGCPKLPQLQVGLQNPLWVWMCRFACMHRHIYIYIYTLSLSLSRSLSLSLSRSLALSLSLSLALSLSLLSLSLSLLSLSLSPLSLSLSLSLHGDQVSLRWKHAHMALLPYYVHDNPKLTDAHGSWPTANNCPEGLQAGHTHGTSRKLTLQQHHHDFPGGG